MNSRQIKIYHIKLKVSKKYNKPKLIPMKNNIIEIRQCQVILNSVHHKITNYQ